MITMKIQTFHRDTLPPRSVVIKPVGGLGSRMKCMASFGAIAKHFDVPLHVFWDTSVGFEKIKCSDLFETLPANVLLIDRHSWIVIRAHQGRVVKLDERISYLTQNYKYADYKLEELFTTRKLFHLTAECNRDLQKLYGNVLRRFIPDFTTTYLHHLSSFKPVADVRKLVAHEVNCWGDTTTNVLGVHIRRNDALYSRVGNKYAIPTNQQLNVAIDAHLAQTSTNASIPSTHLVFLSVDDPNAFQFFQSAYADEPRVRWYPWKRYAYQLSAEKTGQRKALVDLMTLRCCNRVIGTAFSVFNEVAQVSLARSVVLHTYCARLHLESSCDIVHTLVQEIDDEPDPIVSIVETQTNSAINVATPTTSTTPTTATLTSTTATTPTSTTATTLTSTTTPTPTTPSSFPSQATSTDQLLKNPEPSTLPNIQNPSPNTQTSDQQQEQKPNTQSYSDTSLEEDTSTPEPRVASIPRKTLEYLYNANPDAVVYREQMQTLLGFPSDPSIQQ